LGVGKYLISVSRRVDGHARLPYRSAPALHAGNRLPLASCRPAASSSCLAATSVTRLKLSVVTRDNSNAGTELAAKDSLHPISCFALRVGPRKRTDRPALVCRVHGTRPGAGAAGPAGLRGSARRGPWAPVVTTAGPRGGAINEGDKNAAQAPHTATVSPQAGKVNVCHRSAAGDAFFPRRLGARQSSPPVPARAFLASCVSGSC
jgi:hypothetical protein